MNSPMPGSIFKIECTVGQSVKAGDVLVDASSGSELADACRKGGLELTDAQVDGHGCFVVSSKDARRFRYLLAERAEKPSLREDLTRVSLIGDKLDQLENVPGRMNALAEGGAIASRFTPGCCSVWVSGDGKSTLLQAHKEFLEG